MTEPRRAYRSALREEQARRTRVAVLDAAASCFLARGFGATTMKDIADAAGVSAQTVFSQGSKAALLLGVVDRAVVGDDEEQPLIERGPIRALLAEDDKRAKLALARAVTVQYWTSAEGPLAVFRDAAGTDAELAAAWAEHERRRYVDAHVMIESFGPLLRAGVTVGYATDVFWSAMSIETVRNLRVGRGWTMEQVADWLVELLDRLLLA